MTGGPLFGPAVCPGHRTRSAGLSGADLLPPARAAVADVPPPGASGENPAPGMKPPGSRGPLEASHFVQKPRLFPRSGRVCRHCATCREKSLRRAGFAASLHEHVSKRLGVYWTPPCCSLLIVDLRIGLDFAICRRSRRTGSQLDRAPDALSPSAPTSSPSPSV